MRMLSAVNRQRTSVSFLLLLTACSTPPEQVSRTKIRVVTQPYLALAPIHIAVAESLFAKHGLDVELVPMTRPSDAVPLLLSGELDVLSSTAQAGMFNAAARGEPVRMVAERGFYSTAS
ncbi:MAG TPA: ABC transporter substrate-binding protein, partial [Gemmatimonadaceae bacterium]